ncbi:ABC transporter permease [Bordetella flabilis]|uniref:ABC transporter permease n=1 Tax=Bordetella flabilis TaxID=463014 RepID=A0A193GE43_9BORD|nr:ABC transporter permease subunit [Bordetella flabilis]ANN77888.1 ABC transporter permease [Bordetella flabilis]
MSQVDIPAGQSVKPVARHASMASRPAAAGPRPNRRDRRDLKALICVVVLLLVAMQVASGYVPDYVMPSPEAIAKALAGLFGTDLVHVAITLARLAAAIVFSALAGVIIGLLMGTSKRVGPYLKAVVIIDTGIPALSWMLLAVFWFKDPEARIFFILAVILLPFYALNVYEGVRALSAEWVDMLESFRPSRWQMLRFLVAPHIIPYIFLTTKSVIGYAIRMVIFAELVASAVGIGSRMSFAQSTFRIDQVMAWTFLLVMLNLVFQWLAGWAERRFLGWRKEAQVR